MDIYSFSKHRTFKADHRRQEVGRERGRREGGREGGNEKGKKEGEREGERREGDGVCHIWEGPAEQRLQLFDVTVALGPGCQQVSVGGGGHYPVQTCPVLKVSFQTPVGRSI
jgi:hypothetical protein